VRRGSFRSCWGVPSQINCVLFGFSELIGRHPEVQIPRESIIAASKSELIRKWTVDKSLHIISIEVTSW